MLFYPKYLMYTLVHDLKGSRHFLQTLAFFFPERGDG
jgi:hypothetical protein